MSLSTGKRFIKLVTELPGPKSSRILERKKNLIPRSFASLAPVVIERAEGALVVDVDGNQFLDMTGGMGVLNVGHTPGKIVRSIQQQAEKFLHTDFSLIPYEVYINLAEQLLSFIPGPSEKKVAFFNTGAEAVENAVKIARKATGKRGIIAFEGAFHGRSYMALSLTSKYKPYKSGFGPFASEVYRAPYPDVYRCPFGSQDEAECLERTLNWLERMMTTHVSAEETAALIVEPVLGEGGFVVPPRGFLRGLRDFCDRHEILLIIDEIQTGFGRTGLMFAVEHEGVEPDLMLLAKSLAAGLPLSAVVGRADLMDAPAEGELGGTYPGNPLACAAALEVLELFREQNLLANARSLGEQIKSFWLEMSGRHEFVGDVRGLGAMIGVEFVRNRQTKEPHADLLDAFISRSMQRGVLLVKCGVYSNVLRFLAPLTMTSEQLDEALGAMEEVLSELS